MPDAPGYGTNVPAAPPWTAPPPDKAADADAWFEEWLQQNFPPDESGRAAGQMGPEALAVREEWTKLSAAQKTSVFTQIRGMGRYGTPDAVASLLQKTAAAPAATPTPPTGTTGTLNAQDQVGTAALATGTPVQGTTAATALINQYMTTPQWQGSPDDPQSAAAALGVDYNSADQQYQKYLAHFQTAMDRATSLTQHAAPPMPEVSFIQSLAQAQYGQWGPAIGMIAYMWQQQNGSALPSDLATGLIAQLKTFAARDPNGAAQLQLQMLSTVEQIKTSAGNTSAASGGQATNLNIGVDITNFLTQLGGIAPNIYSSGSSGSSALAASSPNSFIGQYIEKNPNVAGEAATVEGGEKKSAIDFLTAQNMPTTAANITALSNPQTLATMGAYVQWMNTVKMPITPAILTTLMSMPFSDPNTGMAPTGTGGAYLLDQVMPGTKMTYGAYQTVSSSITPQWEQYFNSTPNKAQLAYFVGKSPTDVTDYFNNSMSSIPGITIGQKNDYENFIQSLDQQSPQVAGITHTFSSQVDNSMMDQLHQQVTAQSTGKPVPGKM
jgi:hypothetical protein